MNGLETGKINRKTFLRLAAFAIASAFVFLWNRITAKQKFLNEKPVFTRLNISALGNGVHFYPTFITVKSAESIAILSNKCTHAGCRINQEMEGVLICPCHGSRFEAANGKVLQGPAGMPLLHIPFVTDKNNNEIIIKSWI